jgi:hypothetical protein
MVSSFRDPVFGLGHQASEIMEAFYNALHSMERLGLKDLLTFGGNSYADLKLTINLRGGAGRIDITPGFLIVEFNPRDLDAKERFQLYEDTLRKALKDVVISERLMRARLWLVCEGSSQAVEAFLGEKGNAALKLDQGAYATLKKQFSFQFRGLDTLEGKRIGLTMEPSLHEGDLFLLYDHVCLGSPAVSQTVTEQFEEAEKELQTLMLQVGLEPKDHAGKPQ